MILNICACQCLHMFVFVWPILTPVQNTLCSVNYCSSSWKADGCCHSLYGLCNLVPLQSRCDHMIVYWFAIILVVQGKASDFMFLKLKHIITPSMNSCCSFWVIYPQTNTISIRIGFIMIYSCDDVFIYFQNIQI